MALFLDLKRDESVLIDDGRVVITLREKSGQRARLEIKAEKSIKIRHGTGKSIVANGLEPRRK